MADIVTPNLKEASALLGGIPLETVADMCSAAKSIHDIGARSAVECFYMVYVSLSNQYP